MLWPIWGVETVARKMGVTEARVRQLAGAGKMPKRIPGMKAWYWPAESIRAHLREGAQSGTVSRLGPADHPLRLETDALYRYKTIHGEYPIHVRIYQGADRTVVLLSEPVADGSRLLINHVEEIVDEVANRYLDGDIGMATWIDLWPQDYGLRRSMASPRSDISNIVLRRDDERPYGRRWADPQWVPMDLEELTSVLGGAPVYWVPWAHYTTEVVEAYQRQGQPVKVVDDPMDMQPVVAAYRTFQAQGETLSPKVYNVAKKALLITLALRSTYTHTANPLARDAEEPWPASTVVREVPYELPQDVAAELLDPEAVTDSWAAAKTDMDLLNEALELVDEYADGPDPLLEKALQQAIAGQRDVLTLVDPLSRYTYTPSFRVRHVTLQPTGWDAEYLRGCTWLEHDPRETEDRKITRRQARMLAKAAYQPGKFGIDAFGHPVLVDDPQSKRGRTNLVVLWPTRYVGAVPLPYDVRLVAVEEGGDRPVYLARHNTMIGLLPHKTGDQWNFGYGGGGPDALARDIQAFAAGIGEHLDRKSADAATGSAVTGNLDINVDQLIGRAK